MKKKYVVLSCVIGIFFISIISYNLIKSSKNSNVYLISDIVQYNDKITSITILNGVNGKINEVSDENTIKLIKEYISSLKINSKKLDDSTGFQYSLTLYNSTDIVGNIVFINSKLININGKYYEIVDSNDFDLKTLVH